MENKIAEKIAEKVDDEINKKSVKKIIDETVNVTVAKLKLSGLMKDNGLTAFQKTERALRLYRSIQNGHSEKGISDKFVELVDNALEGLKDDLYYEIIPMTYFEGMTREQVAEYFDTTVTTISRHKTRLINKLTPVLFSDDTIIELFS